MILALLVIFIIYVFIYSINYKPPAPKFKVKEK